MTREWSAMACLAAGILALILVAACICSPDVKEKCEMRYLFEDLEYNDGESYGAAGYNAFNMTAVTLPAVPNMIDLWFWVGCVNDSQARYIYAYATQDEAWAAADAGAAGENWVAKNEDLHAYDSTHTLTDNGAIGPDLTGLTIDASIAVHGKPITFAAIWGWTSKPCTVLLTNVKALLRDRTGDGQTLEEFKTEAIDIGDSVQLDVDALPAISLKSTSLPVIGSISPGKSYQARCRLIVTVAVMDFDGPTQAWQKCRRFQGAVRSILADEERTATDLVEQIIATETPAPEMTGAEIDDRGRVVFAVGKVEFEAEFAELRIEA